MNFFLKLMFALLPVYLVEQTAEAARPRFFRLPTVQNPTRNMRPVYLGRVEDFIRSPGAANMPTFPIQVPQNRRPIALADDFLIDRRHQPVYLGMEPRRQIPTEPDIAYIPKPVRPLAPFGIESFEIESNNDNDADYYLPRKQPLFPMLHHNKHENRILPMLNIPPGATEEHFSIVDESPGSFYRETSFVSSYDSSRPQKYQAAASPNSGFLIAAIPNRMLHHKHENLEERFFRGASSGSSAIYLGKNTGSRSPKGQQQFETDYYPDYETVSRENGPGKVELNCNGNHWVVKPGTFRCCGEVLYNMRTERCLGTNRVTKKERQANKDKDEGPNGEHFASHLHVPDSKMIVCQGHHYLVPKKDTGSYGCCGRSVYNWLKEDCQSGRVISSDDYQVETSILTCDGVQHLVPKSQRTYWGCCGEDKYDLRREACDALRKRRSPSDSSSSSLSLSRILKPMILDDALPRSCPENYICCENYAPVENQNDKLRCCPGEGPFNPDIENCPMLDDFKKKKKH